MRKEDVENFLIALSQEMESLVKPNSTDLWLDRSFSNSKDIAVVPDRIDKLKDCIEIYEKVNDVFRNRCDN
jgi:hypothetical protein